MAYEHKEGQGSLFKNEKQNDRQPDYKGTILIGGVTYRIVAWEKTSQSGTKFMSLQAEPQQEGQTLSPRQPYPQQRQEPQEQRSNQFNAQPLGGPDDDEDLPF